MTEQAPQPNPETLWGRRWKSHVATILVLAGYLAAIPVYDAPTEPVWPLVMLALGYVAPAIAEQLAKLRRP